VSVASGFNFEAIDELNDDSDRRVVRVAENVRREDWRGGA
jgi:hypothetical protein